MPTIHPLDISIVCLYLLAVVVSGIVLSRRAAKNIDSYFLGGRTLPWYLLGISNASGQFDITGTMWLVMLMFVYGLKSIWIPWLWPTFNQVFLMVFLATWLRRSNVLTGAEWLQTRFGNGAGRELAHLSVVLFALVNVVGFLAYAFVGIGKFAQIFLPWQLEAHTYAMLMMSVTAVYVILGGMYSVVLTDLAQFVLLAIASVCVGVIAMQQTSYEAIAAATPIGWNQLTFGWNLDLDWSGTLVALNERVASDGYAMFGPFVMMAFFKGVLASLAGPAPNYDMQRVLATRTAREAALMSGSVSLVLYVPRYFLIAGIVALALVFYSDQLAAMGTEADFEQILPYVIGRFVPIGLTGILLAGLFAAFMSTFDSTVNAGAAYLVNDVYRRYLRPEAKSRHYVIVSYLCSVGVVAAGMLFGSYGRSINEILQWITAGLYGGYVAPNVLKWIWWRLNGWGYFAGMVTGVVFAMMIPVAWPDWEPLFAFPYLLGLSMAASLLASWVTPADSMQVLSKFYRQVRPWGFWGPVHHHVATEEPQFVPNKSFARDAVNCAVGIAWQLALSALPVFLVIREMKAFGITLAVVIATTVFLKVNWYDRLEDQ